MEGRPLEDLELVDRAKRGDVDAYEALVRRYQQLASRVAYVITGQREEAEDAVQDAFVKAYYALSSLRAGASFRPWLLRIVTNEARNRRRSAGRRGSLVERLGRARPGDGAPDEDSPETAAVAAERRLVLASAMDSLDERDRTVLALRYFAELSEAEMATALGCSPGTVKSRLSRARERLRLALAGQLEEVGS